MKRARSTIQRLFLLLALLPSVASAFNYHDHLSYVPSGRHFTEAWDQIRHLTIHELFLSRRGAGVVNRDFNFYMGNLGLGADTEAGRACIRSIGRTTLDRLTLEQLVTAIADARFRTHANPREAAMDFLFAMPADAATRLPLGDRRSHMMHNNQLRNVLVERIDAPGLKRVFARTFREGGTDLWVLHASTSAHFGDAATVRAKLTAVREAFFEAAAASDNAERRTSVTPAHFKLYFGITRERLLLDFADRPQALRAYLERLLATGLFAGFDFSGSILEGGARGAAGTAAQFEELLLEAFRVAQERNVEIRIHAFEARADGPFYEGLARALTAFERECAAARPRPERPVRIRLGHIAFLDNEVRPFLRSGWVDYLAARNRGFLEFVLEANMVSNGLFQDVALDTFIRRLGEAQRAGLNVVLGSDGFGMMPESAYRAQVAAINERILEILTEPTGPRNPTQRRIIDCFGVTVAFAPAGLL